MAKHKHLSITLRQTALKAGLSLVAVSTMFSGMALAADGGSGSSGGTTGGGGYTSQVVWATNDNFGPAADQTVMSVLTGQLAGKTYTNTASNVATATANAKADCERNYAARHNGDATGANCRVFGVGAVKSNIGVIADATGGLTQNQWMTAWMQEVNNKRYTHNGQSYETSVRLSSGMSIDGLAARETAGGNRSIVVITLAADQPRVWEYTPDKSWLMFENNQWKAVVDPQHSNSTGADTHTVLDGSKLGSAVNGVVAANLGTDLTTFSLTDDYTAADYVFDADSNDIHVYSADVTDDAKSSVADIVNHGQDVTSQFDIAVNGTTVTATMKANALTQLQSSQSAKQFTLLIGGTANFANGQGAAQVRADAGKKPGGEVTFCTTPQAGTDLTAHGLINKGSETAGSKSKSTNEPYICGYVPPVMKDVLGEASQGGDQDSIDGKSVFPGQRVEYTLTTTPTIPQNLTEPVTKVAFDDTYDQYLELDKQTIEVNDLNTGRTVSKKDYTLSVDADKHMFAIELKSDYVKAHFVSSSAVRYQVRFEGTVSKEAPTDHILKNQWALRLNNSVTPSNEVSNKPVKPQPTKKDETKTGISIDGKTAYYGDDIYYRLTLDAANLSNSAYRIQRLGLVDDYDEEYLNLDESGIEVLDQTTGQDVTSKFNIQVKNGVVYAFVKTVDTQYLGDTLKGDPQPSDLKAYSEQALDPKTQPGIDQTVLGHSYTLVLPMKVAKVTDGYVVKNTATQITNERRDVTNTVTNPVKEINPHKDVTVNVNGESANGKSIYKNHQFLYRLDSSQITANRAYKQIENWRIVDDYDQRYDQVTGQWAVYANNDITDTVGAVVFKKGERVDGSTVNKGYFTFEDKDGVFTLEATSKFLDLASNMDADLSWTGYVQMTRTNVSNRVENRFVETLNNTKRESNLVWTKTPDLTPSIKLIKYDAKSGITAGDRNTPAEALTHAKNGTKVVFRIINTGSVDLTKITLTDKTIAGTGTVTNLKYPEGWDTLVLKPGAYVEVTGTLTNMTGTYHTDRGTTTGTPIVPCDTSVKDPFNPKPQVPNTGNAGVCYDTPVTASDDWNAVKGGLASTGSTIIPIAVATLLIAGMGTTIVLIRRAKATPSTKEDAVTSK